MYSKRLILFVAVSALVHLFRQSKGVGLEAKLAAAKLRTSMDVNAAVYDGNDTVYISGG
jgi:hypothetical protein